MSDSPSRIALKQAGHHYREAAREIVKTFDPRPQAEAGAEAWSERFYAAKSLVNGDFVEAVDHCKKAARARGRFLLANVNQMTSPLAAGLHLAAGRVATVRAVVSLRSDDVNRR